MTSGTRLLWLALSTAAACGDSASGPQNTPDGAAAGDDVVFGDTATTTTDIAVTLPSDAIALDTTEATSDVSAPTEAGVADGGDVAVDAPIEDTPDDGAPDVVDPTPLGDDCAHPHALADDDHDRHYDALGDIGAAAGLADDLDARACDLDDARVNGEGKADEVWRFTAPGAGDYRVSVLADTNIDVHFYLLDAATCTTCLGADDTGGVGDIDSRVVTLAAGDAIAIVIDGKRSAHAGAYIVDVYACEGACE